MLRRFTVVVAFSLCIMGLSRSSIAKDGAKPNVVLIYTDDQGYGDASCLNANAKFATPNLDRLASAGITFTDGHSSDTVCTPSRYGLLTGRYAWRTSLKKGVMGAEGTCLIEDGRVTLASLLREQGYATGMVGKWHLGMDFPGTDHKTRDWSKPVMDMPLDKGFDHFFGIPASLNYGVLAWFEGRYAKVPPTVFTNKKPNKRHVDYRIMPPYENTPEETQELVGRKGMEVAPDFIDNQCLTRFTDEALNWIDSNTESSKAGNSFFLYLPLTSPHYPVCPLPEFHGQGSAGGYGEFMIETDHHVGRILDRLEENGIASNTLVIFTSDNGPENSWRQRATEFKHQSNARYREGKRSIYEGGHRVPFLMCWPDGIVEPGRECGVPVSQTDILATLADLLGVELADDAGEDSQSILPLLKGDTSMDHQPLVHHASNGQFAIRSGRWKLVMPHGKKKAQLFDLEVDPSESNVIVGDHDALVDELQTKLTEIVCFGRTSAGPKQANDTGYWTDLAWLSEQDYEAHAASD